MVLCGLLACITPDASADPPILPEAACKSADAQKALVPAPACNASAPAKLPQHVFLIVLENEGYEDTFGPCAPPSYLKDLAKHGLLLTNYYAIGHNSLDNYIAMISGQAPNGSTQADCSKAFVDFTNSGEEPKPGAAQEGRQPGQGCVYPATIKTVANQLADKKLAWRGYMDSMPRPCRHPELNQPDFKGPYVTKHNPFVFFRSIIGKDPRPRARTSRMKS